MPSTEVTVSRWVRRSRLLDTRCRQCTTVAPSSSLLDCLGRVRRVKAKPLRSRFASLDPAATARGMAAIEEDGEEQGTRIGTGETRIVGPLAGH